MLPRLRHPKLVDKKRAVVLDYVVMDVMDLDTDKGRGSGGGPWSNSPQYEHHVLFIDIPGLSFTSRQWLEEKAEALPLGTVCITVTWRFTSPSWALIGTDHNVRQ